uniref:Ribonuclease H-like domain-containing protein n=1 Tax=Tanacetum cinerariifolium TaxID=118510 RepID=A0A6L2LTW1_TANCI|nr:ribonuclease H-like domain-containing protein [Tanacetum cinerariifolium]
MTKDEVGNEVEVPPVTAQQILARTRERKAKSSLLMAIPDEHLARFYGIKDTKTLWAAIKTIYGEGLDKGYNRFQRLLGLLEIHGTEKINQDDLEEIDLKWQVAMLSMRVKQFYNKNGRKLKFNGKEPVGFNKTMVECFNYHRRGNFARDCKTAKNPRNRGRDAGNARYKGRDNGKRPAREEDEKALLDEALREKEDLKAKLQKFETSSKNLTKLRDSQISAKVKTGLGYDSQFNAKEVLDVKEEEVSKTVFDNRSSDKENSLANDRLKKGEGFHAVPPPLTGNYMPPKLELSFFGLDDYIYKFKISETVTSLSKDVKDALETSTFFAEKPKEVRTSAPLIKE